MIAMRRWATSLVLAVSATAAHAQTDARGALQALHAGRYDAAIADLARLASEPTANAAVRRAHVQALLEVGRQSEAEAAARRHSDAANGAELAATLGLVLRERGEGPEARRLFERAVSGGASDSLEARVALAALLDESGDRTGATAQWQRVADAGRGARLNVAQWIAVGDAEQRLARTEPARVRTALRAFDAAAAIDSTDPAPRLRAGALFLEKYNAPEARAAFEAVLRANPRQPDALLGLARVRQFEGVPGAVALAESSLVVNPRLVAAHLLLASAYLDAEDYARADSSVARARAVDSTAPGALTLLAAVRQLKGDAAGYEVARRQLLARAPTYATFYATIADLAARHRHYADAARLGAAGVALDSTSWRSHAVRGINQLRLGHADSARASLERAFAGDPFDVSVKNTLDLLDATRSYRTERSARFSFVADTRRGDAALAVPRRAAGGRRTTGSRRATPTAHRRSGWSCIAATRTSRCAPSVSPDSARSA